MSANEPKVPLQHYCPDCKTWYDCELGVRKAAEAIKALFPGYHGVVRIEQIEQAIEAACSQTVAPGEHSRIPDDIGLRVVERGTHYWIVNGYGTDIADCGMGKEWADELVRKWNVAAPPAVSTPRCPVCGDSRLPIMWHDRRITCQNCEAKFEHLITLADFRQFFQPDSQPPPEGERE